jgi:hypothetical protein
LRIVAVADADGAPDMADGPDVVTLAPCGVVIGLLPNAAFANGAAASTPAAQNAAAASANTRCRNGFDSNIGTLSLKTALAMRAACSPNLFAWSPTHVEAR